MRMQVTTSDCTLTHLYLQAGDADVQIFLCLEGSGFERMIQVAITSVEAVNTRTSRRSALENHRHALTAPDTQDRQPIVSIPTLHFIA
jgi:hypothetical protein